MSIWISFEFSQGIVWLDIVDFDQQFREQKNTIKTNKMG